LTPVIASTSDETVSALPTTSVPVDERLLDEKLQALKQAIVVEVAAELRRATQPMSGASLDPRKCFVAGIIGSRPPSPKMSGSEILSEADRYQNQFPKKAHYRPPPAWKVRCWADMKGDNKAQAWIAKIRADPRYLRPDYLTRRGKERL